MKSFLQDNDIEIYSTQTEGKYDVRERFTRILSNKIYKFTMHIDQLDWIVDECNNTY